MRLHDWVALLHVLTMVSLYGIIDLTLFQTCIVIIVSCVYGILYSEAFYRYKMGGDKNDHI